MVILMFRTLLLTIILFTSSALFSKDPIAISCTNIKGNTLDFVNESFITEKDGYSGTTISLIIGDSGSMVQYSGRVSRTDEITLIASSTEGWMTFAKSFNDVMKLYTIYPKTMILSLVEIQTQVLTGAPQVRSFMASCQ